MRQDDKSKNKKSEDKNTERFTTNNVIILKRAKNTSSEYNQPRRKK